MSTFRTNALLQWHTHWFKGPNLPVSDLPTDSKDIIGQWVTYPLVQRTKFASEWLTHWFKGPHLPVSDLPTGSKDQICRWVLSRLLVLQCLQWQHTVEGNSPDNCRPAPVASSHPAYPSVTHRYTFTHNTIHFTNYCGRKWISTCREKFIANKL